MKIITWYTIDWKIKDTQFGISMRECLVSQRRAQLCSYGEIASIIHLVPVGVKETDAIYFTKIVLSFKINIVTYSKHTIHFINSNTGNQNTPLCE